MRSPNIFYNRGRELDLQHLGDVLLLIRRGKSKRYGKIHPKFIEAWERQRDVLINKLNSKALSLGFESAHDMFEWIAHLGLMNDEF